MPFQHPNETGYGHVIEPFSSCPAGVMVQVSGVV